jgi:hypothetical protein
MTRDIMNGPQAVFSPAQPLTVIAKDIRVRILNCSPGGCLLETNTRVGVGTVGTLHLTIDGQEFVDHVQIVRCQPIKGAGSMYHIGVQFLWTAPVGSRTLRWALSIRAPKT